MRLSTRKKKARSPLGQCEKEDEGSPSAGKQETSALMSAPRTDVCGVGVVSLRGEKSIRALRKARKGNSLQPANQRLNGLIIWGSHQLESDRHRRPKVSRRRQRQENGWPRECRNGVAGRGEDIRQGKNCKEQYPVLQSSSGLTPRRNYRMDWGG